MELQTEAYQDSHLGAIIRLSLRAWAPVFDSMKNMMEPAVYQQLYPDWRAVQQKAVTDVCSAADTHVWVAVEAGAVVGFVAVKLEVEPGVGELYMLAVDPAAQGRGVGSGLAAFAVDWMRAAGMSIATIGTGGDPGHAAARHTYEKLGFRPFPIAQYYKKL